MEYCDEKCCLCNQTGKISVNHAKYHKVCKIHYLIILDLSLIKCVHCQSSIVIVKEFLKCFDCKQKNISRILKCGHSACSDCWPLRKSHCRICNSRLCKICNNFTEKICEECLGKCTNCRKNLIKCIFCTEKLCDCEFPDKICLKCKKITCKNCKKFQCVKEMELLCKHFGCIFCETEKICVKCLESGKFCDRCKDPKVKCNRCNNLICKCLNGLGLCDKCETKSLDSRNKKVHQCQLCKNHVSKVKSNVNCDHLLCKNCLKKSSCEICKSKIIDQTISCDFCNRKKRVGMLYCGHFCCESCNTDPCKIQTEIYFRLNCQECNAINCQKYFNLLNSLVCENCFKKKPICNFCCPKCRLDPRKKVLNTKCNKFMCPECFVNHVLIDKCQLCFKRCGVCKEIIRDKETTAECGHQVCSLCNKNRKCLNCLLLSKDYDKKLPNLRDICAICFEKPGNIKLFCGDFICIECKKYCGIKFLNYCCPACCLNKKKTCLECLQYEKFEEIGNSGFKLNKVCCKRVFCLVCMKKKSFFDIFMKKPCMHK